MYLAKLPSIFCQQERRINYELKTFSSSNDELVNPEKAEKYKRFMPGADERIFAGDGKRTGTPAPTSENVDGNLIAPCNTKSNRV